MNLKQKLDDHYNSFNRTKLEPDPLQFLHLFSRKEDIELMGFVASVFAYGNVKQIENTLKKIVMIFEGKPYSFIKKYSVTKDEKKFYGIKHRFYTEDDIKKFFFILNKELKKYDSLK